MSNNIRAFTVILDKDIDPEYFESLAEAIKHFKNVLEVIPDHVEVMADAVASARVHHELGRQILEIIYPAYKPTTNW